MLKKHLGKSRHKRPDKQDDAKGKFYHCYVTKLKNNSKQQAEVRTMTRGLGSHIKVTVNDKVVKDLALDHQDTNMHKELVDELVNQGWHQTKKGSVSWSRKHLPATLPIYTYEEICDPYPGIYHAYITVLHKNGSTADVSTKHIGPFDIVIIRIDNKVIKEYEVVLPVAPGGENAESIHSNAVLGLLKEGWSKDDNNNKFDIKPLVESAKLSVMNTEQLPSSESIQGSCIKRSIIYI